MRERERGDKGIRSRTDEEGRGTKEMEAEGAGRCDGRNFFSHRSSARNFLSQEGGERERKVITQKFMILNSAYYMNI